jgi:hypothetical protein
MYGPGGLQNPQNQRGLNQQQQQQQEAGTPFFGEGTEEMPGDTLKKKRPKKPLESYFFADSVRSRENMVWTVDMERNHIRIGHIDTLQRDFQIQYPFMKKGVGSAYLGNLGAPSRYLNFFDQRHDRDHSFADAWRAYLVEPDEMPFYNVKKPFSQASYAMAGQKARQEEDLFFILAGNVSPQTGFNLNYSSLGTRGIYRWQATRDKRFSFGFNHTGKRYTIHAGYIWNSINNHENGGLFNDDDVVVNARSFEISTGIPVKMSDPVNDIRSNTFFLVQSFGIPLRRVTDRHFTIAGHPAVFIGHSAEYSRWARKYKDTFAGTLYRPEGSAETNVYFHDWNIYPTRSRDSIFEGKLSNRVFVQLQPWDRNGVIGTIDGGVGVDWLQYYNFDLSQYNTGVRKTAVNEYHYYAYAAIDGHVRRYFDWGADFKIHPYGQRAGDIEAGGNVEARVFVRGRPMSVSGNVRFTTQEASYWAQHYVTNHFIWHNSFRKEGEMRFDVTLKIPHIGFEASGHQSILTNRVYFGQDCLPRQHAETVSVTGLYVREDLCIPIKSSSLNFNHRVMAQWSSDQTVIPVPMVSAYLTYFFEFNVVKDVLRLQIGFEGRYNTRYYAPGYNVGTGQFYNQREKQLGDYAWVDMFVNAKWKRMRILLKIDHLNEDMFGNRNYFSVPHYPMNKRIFKIGISWNFYD